MSHFTPPTTAPLTRRRRSRGALAAVAGGGAAIAALAVAIVAGADPGPSGLERTGEVNAMGMPVVATPGHGSGTAAAGSVTVDAARWELGRVPLNVAVRPTWTLRNTGDEPVSLGEPHPEVRAGCCPGPAVLGTRTLQPGESTPLTFELSMHPGMDGPHDLALHVPIDDGIGDAELLTVEVTGDFGD